MSGKSVCTHIIAETPGAEKQSNKKSNKSKFINRNYLAPHGKMPDMPRAKDPQICNKNDLF